MDQVGNKQNGKHCNTSTNPSHGKCSFKHYNHHDNTATIHIWHNSINEFNARCMHVPGHKGVISVATHVHFVSALYI